MVKFRALTIVPQPGNHLSFEHDPVKQRDYPMEVTYKIIGGDSREYGVVSLAELKSWIREGRVVGTTPVRRSDLEMWQPVAQYPELEPDIGQVTAVSSAALDEHLEPVGFWPLLGAYLVDFIVLYAIFFIGWGWL